MTKEKIKELRTLALKLRVQIDKMEWDFGIPNTIVYDGTTHKVADVYEGLYNVTPIENMQMICASKNNIHKFVDAFLELTK